MAAAARGPTCRTCSAALARCWVCGEAVRCAGCQQCLRCEGLLDDGDTGTIRASAPTINIPTVRLRRTKPEARPRPSPPPATPTGRQRARRVVPPRTSVPFVTAVWHVRVAVVPGLMLLAAYWCYTYFRTWSGLGLAAACAVGFYLPYVVLTPVRRAGVFFPLGDEGPALPVVMLVGGLLVGGVCGIILGVLGGERIGIWGGSAVAVIAFHALYYATVVEKSRAAK